MPSSVRYCISGFDIAPFSNVACCSRASLVWESTGVGLYMECVCVRMSVGVASVQMCRGCQRETVAEQTVWETLMFQPDCKFI